MNIRRLVMFGGGGLVAVMLAASLAPSPFGAVKAASGGKILEGHQIDPAAVSLMQRACANCHSHQTTWPWYARIVPVSWMVDRDVSEARKFLNFSLWPEYGAEGQRQLLELAAADIESGKMPPARYLALHPEARFTEAERTLLKEHLPEEAKRLAALAGK